MADMSEHLDLSDEEEEEEEEEEDEEEYDDEDWLVGLLPNQPPKPTLAEELQAFVGLAEPTYAVCESIVFQLADALRQDQCETDDSLLLHQLVRSSIDKLMVNNDTSIRSRLADAVCEIVEGDLYPTVGYGTFLIARAFQLLQDEHELTRITGRKILATAVTKDIDLLPHFQTNLISFLKQVDFDDQVDNTNTTFFLEFLQLVIAVAPKLNIDFCETELVFYVKTLGATQDFRIRKMCVGALSAVAARVNQAVAMDSLIPTFFTLAEDDIWGVRKAAAEHLAEISEVLDIEQRHALVTRCFCKLAKDESRWVRCAAYKNLGSLIATFAPPPPLYDEMVRLQLQQIVAEETAQPTRHTNKRQRLRYDLRDVDTSETMTDADENTNLNHNHNHDINHDNDNDHNYDHDHDHNHDNHNHNDNHNHDHDHDEVGNGHKDDNHDHDSNSNTNHNKNGDLTEHTRDDEVMADAFPAAADVRLPRTPVHPVSNRINTRRISPAPWDLAKFNRFLQAESAVPEPPRFDSDEPENFNSFSFWKNPLPTVDLSELLGDRGNTSNNGNDERISDVEPSPTSTTPSTPSTPTTPMAKTIMSVESASLLTPVVEEHDSASPSPSSPEKEKEKADEETSLCVPMVLVEHFRIMSLHASTKSIDSEIMRTCAFSIPAVIWALGRSNWHLISNTYIALAEDMDWKVRASISHSCHICALILGREIAETDLLPHFTKFLKDWEEVRYGAIQHFTDFVQVISPDLRDSSLESLVDLSQVEESNNWRRRLAVIEQLGLVIRMLPIKTIVASVEPVALALMVDRVACVRLRAHATVASLIARLAQDDEAAATELCKKLVTTFCKSERSSDRQGFAQVCRHLPTHATVPASFFASSVFESCVALAEDLVPNVRLLAARTLINIVKLEYFADLPQKYKVDDVLSKLRNDPDRDVVYYACSTSSLTKA